MSDCLERISLTMRTFEQFDGSMWRQYESPEALFLLTEVGRKLIAADHIGGLLRRYADDYNNDRESPDDIRRAIADGSQSRVFGVSSSRMAIKEKDPEGEDLFGALHRMDRLIDAIIMDPSCPGWIGVPQHYGIVVFKKNPARQFMLMQKIDEGVSVGDVLNYRNLRTERDAFRPPQLKEAVEHTYGPITDEFQEEIAGRYGMALGHLRRALIAKYLSPDRYIPDLDHNPDNIVLESLDEPIDGSSVKLWVIDQ